MMERKIIYYPYIIPPSQWLKWAVLYFDKVSSVMPENVADSIYYGEIPRSRIISSTDREGYDNMRILMQEGEFEPADPIILRRSSMLKGLLNEEFKSIVDSEKFVVNRNWYHNPTWVHQDKLIHDLYEFLHERGLAMEYNQSWEWILMERRTSLVYLSLLAKYFTYADTDNYAITGTSRPEYERIIYFDSSPNAKYALGISLQKVLPIPAPNVSIKKILKFKKKRRYELIYFRNVIDDFQYKITKNPGQHTLVQCKENIQYEVEKLKKMLREDYIDIVLDTIDLTLSNKDIIAAILAGILEPRSIPIMGGIALLKVTVRKLKGLHEQHRQKVEIMGQNEYTYLYLARQKGIIN